MIHLMSFQGTVERKNGNNYAIAEKSFATPNNQTAGGAKITDDFGPVAEGSKVSVIAIMNDTNRLEAVLVKPNGFITHNVLRATCFALNTVSRKMNF